MLGLPNEPLPGQPLRASDQAAFLRYVRNTTVRTSPGALVTTGSGGSTHRRVSKPKYYQWPMNAGAALPYPWEEYVAPYTGGGTPPADQGLQIMFRTGYVSGKLPTNMTTVFPVPPNSSMLLFYLHASVTWSSSGAYTIVNVTIESGATIPADSTASQPTDTYWPLVQVSSNETALTNVLQFSDTVLNLNFVVSNFDCQTRILTAQWTPMNSY